MRMELWENRGRINYYLHQWYWTWIDLLFPPRCVNCNVLGSHFCQACQLCIKKINAPVCQKCGKPQSFERICFQCKLSLPSYTAARSLAAYEGPYRQAIIQLKYKGNGGLGEMLANSMFEFIKGLKWDIDLLVPVPLGKQRLKERGYNQVSLVAKPLAWGLGLEYKPEALSRKRETKSQIGLSREERKRNVKGAFIANKNVAIGKNVLVMDDVFTTGATMNECAKALLSAQASRVFGITLASVEKYWVNESQPIPV